MHYLILETAIFFHAHGKGFAKYLLIFFALSFPFISAAQILQVTPEFPTTDDTVTIIYNAQFGNGELAGYAGDVFAHTGVITTESRSPSDWKHVVDNWGTVDSTTLMESLGNDLYKIKYHIRSFYGIQPNEQVLQLAFVFRNGDGSLVGRSEDNSDIFYDINQFTLGDFQSYSFDGSILTINTDSGSIQIQPFDENMFKVSLVTGVAGNPDSSFSVIMIPSSLSPVVDDETQYLEFSTGNFKVHAKKFPLRLSFVFNGDTILKDEAGLYQSLESGGVFLQLTPGEHIYGTGSRAIDIDRRGKMLTSYNTAQYGYSNGAETLNINIPFITSSKLYGVYMDNYSPGMWDIGNTDTAVLNYSSESGAFSYFVIAGNSNEEILDHYTQLTGRQPLPPRWALGYIQSKFGYQNETEARNIVNLMQQDNFPLDALVLDLYWYGDPSTMGNLDWDYSRFQYPVDMMHDFDSMGVKTICITEPYIVQSSSNFSYLNTNNLLATDTAGNSFVIGNFWAGSAGLLDMFSPSSQDWMWNYYEDRITEGVTGWWCDLGEPENHPEQIEHTIGMARTVHNVYSLIWSEMLFSKYQQYHPEKRLFNLSRSGYAGMQRYSCFPWSGDIQRSFNGLKAQIPIMLGDAMCGVGYMHSDLGGFTGGPQNEELYVRWMEFGSFCPIMRAHGEGVPTEPVYYSANAQIIIRNFSDLRHRLTPYNYSLAYENSVNGTPLTRPLNFYESQNELLSNINDEYFWGENFLVAPVMSQGQTSRNVIFPSGKWISYWNNQIYDGNASTSIAAALDVMPLFVKAGSFIPMVPLVNSLSNYNTDTLIVKYYPDESLPISSFTMYDDDGEDANALSLGNYELINFTGSVSSSETDIVLSKSGNGFNGAPSIRAMNFQLQRITDAPEEVLKNNLPLPIAASLNDFNVSDSAAYWDASAQLLYIHFKWNGINTTIQILDTVTGIDESSFANADFLLLNPLPNPFKKFVTIPYEIYRSGNYSMEISDATGKMIRLFELKHIATGKYNLVWNGDDLWGNEFGAGIYIISLKSANGEAPKKVVKLE